MASIAVERVVALAVVGGAGLLTQDNNEELYSNYKEEEEVGLRVDVATATVLQLDKYIRARIKSYEDRDDVEDVLFDIFKEDFDGWEKAIFKKANPDSIRDLRTALEKRGVTMPNDYNIIDKIVTLRK
jgi:hypothetical protein